MAMRRWRAGPALLLATWCCAAGAAPPQRAFEPRYFTGLAAGMVASEDDATLDIDFDKVGGGLLRFGHCREVKPDVLAQVVPSQAVLADILRLNCVAVRRYAASRPAARNHLPARWSAAAVGKMPAELLHELGPGDQAYRTATRSDATLARRPGQWHITLARDGAVQVTGAEVVALFHRLARADFDGDGNEDWLLRIDWAARQGDARGSELVLVTCPVAGEPMRVIERVRR